jgi:hypothetical protein
MMEPLEKIVKALAAGAANNLRPNLRGLENTAVSNQFYALKALIARKYAQVDEDVLDIGPASAERQQQMMTQLQDVSADEDEEVLQQAEILLTAVKEHDPKAFWASTPIEALSPHS